MDDSVRDGVVSLVRERGLGAVIDAPDRCRAMLRDLFPQHRAEVSVLVAAVEEGIPGALTSAPEPGLRVNALTERLVAERALAPASARWAVTTWLAAVGGDEPQTASRPPDDLVDDSPDDSDPGKPATGRPLRHRELVRRGSAVLAAVAALIGLIDVVNLFGGAPLRALRFTFGGVWLPGDASFVPFAGKLVWQATLLAPWLLLAYAVVVTAGWDRVRRPARLGLWLAGAGTILPWVEWIWIELRGFSIGLPLVLLPLSLAGIVGVWAMGREVLVARHSL